jgi:hypothetical protein
LFAYKRIIDREDFACASTWTERLVEADVEVDGWTIKALNITWIPQPILGQVEVQIREDGRFGLEDPLNWPQCHCSDKPYLALIRRRPSSPDHPSFVLWDKPAYGDFERVNDHPLSEAYGWL